MGDILWSIKIGNWEFGIDKSFSHWWWTNGYVYEFLGYFYIFHFQDLLTDDYKTY